MAHSFSWKILPNSAGQFAKFRGSLQQNHPNSVAYRSLLFVSKLSSILLRNFSFRRLALCLVALVTYKEKLLVIFLFSKVQSAN